MLEQLNQTTSGHIEAQTSLPWPDENALHQAAALLNGNTGDIHSGLDRLSRKLGFDYYSLVTTRCQITRPAQTGMRSNYQAVWQQRYTDRRYFASDPLIRRARHTHLPFVWGRWSEFYGITPAEDHVTSAAREFDIRFGISIPSHGPSGALTLLSMVTSGTEKTLADRVQANYNLLWMISPLVSAAVWADPTSQSGGKEQIILTDHEKLCLLWTLRGKTSWEISRIISRSKPTVEYHLQKSMRKFGVTTKVQAAIRAAAEGLIEV